MHQSEKPSFIFWENDPESLGMGKNKGWRKHFNGQGVKSKQTETVSKTYLAQCIVASHESKIWTLIIAKIGHETAV